MLHISLSESKCVPMNRNEINMTEGRLLPKLLRFIGPLALASVLQLAFNAADLIVVGRFGRPNALAAVGSNVALVSLVVNTFMGLSIGGGVICARFYGAKDRDRLRETVSTALIVGLLGGVALGALGIGLAKPLLRLVGSPDDVAPLAAVYLRIFFTGMPIMALYNFAGAQLRAMGDTRRPFFFLAAAGVVNVLLNLFFVIVVGIDVAGVALATVLSQCLSCFLTVRCLLRTTELELRAIRFSRGIFKDVVRIGLPAGIQGSMYSIANFVIQGAVNSFGAAVITGCAACTSVEGFLFCPVDACQQAATTSVSQNLGAKKDARIVQAAWQCMLVEVLIAGFGAALIYLLRTPLLRLYTTDPAALEAAYVRLRILCEFYILNGAMAVVSGVIRGLGHSTLPAVVTFLGCCVLRIVMIYTWFADAPSMARLFTVYPVSWFVTTAAHCVCYVVIRRKMRAAAALAE